MTSSSSRSLSAFTVPAWLQGRSTATQVLAVLFGTLVLAASSQVSVPMVPVPMTMQTLAVTLVGALYGWRLGAVTVIAWLAQGAMGLPVFAGGAGGIAALAGPTAGYLIGFLPAAWLAGVLTRSAGWWQRGLGLLAAHLVLFVPGVIWLAGFVGLERAAMVGFVLFVPGTLVKTALAFATLRAMRRG